MGKHEVGTPKYIANKIKSKGLQKLRWYCQMCEKQCRDENGFKCHTRSESHHRQLLLFADNAREYMNEFSRNFSEGFLSILKRQFNTTRVLANTAYGYYIADRDHIRMTSTMWLTLTAFVKWLGKNGKCVVDETEGKWYVTYINKDPETLAAQEKKAKKTKMDKDDQERMMDFIEKQVEQGRKENNNNADNNVVPLIRSDDDGPLVLKLNLQPKVSVVDGLAFAPRSVESSKLKIKIKDELLGSIENDNCHMKSSSSSLSSSKRGSKRLHEEIEQQSGWLKPNLVVKIITKTLGSKYYKAKGVILDPVLESGFVGKVEIISPDDVNGHVVKLDQEHLETVIPAIAREVLIVKGHKTGSIAVLKKVRTDEFSVDVELIDKSILKRIPYENICKIHQL
ncbi:DNA/RNA-binding protein KIN17-like [Aphidius gifuensis]|uniref:DNA/RNA-binding protein KIN17-like n=1 Tax=Aphidius gifuensis TaxID=684658 RepID=UPI001CDD4373|nr:DNA/RNA-binding protein KIN17-like [Aphidius gifuensis]